MPENYAICLNTLNVGSTMHFPEALLHVIDDSVRGQVKTCGCTCLRMIKQYEIETESKNILPTKATDLGNICIRTSSPHF